MALVVDGKELETTATGFLVDINDWSEDVAKALAGNEDIELTERHWDLINYLREEFINNGGNQPNNRAILKAMSEKWGAKASSKELYDLFPGNPSKQAGQIGGLSESKRKGGY